MNSKIVNSYTQETTNNFREEKVLLLCLSIPKIPQFNFKMSNDPIFSNFFIDRLKKDHRMHIADSTTQ
jgi:hypothetical protein